MLLKGRIALVTGAGQGNGAAIARGLAKEGARVIATDLNGEAASRTAAGIVDEGGEAWSYALDVANAEACSALARDVEGSIGQVSILVNNAGICPRNTIDSPDVMRSWDAAMQVNLNGTLNVTLAFVPALRATKGTVINMASIASFVSTATSCACSPRISRRNSPRMVFA
jgi:NAD(P)-dependent dehydrogenase (short-subunit alcohol dehydrogenase family)